MSNLVVFRLRGLHVHENHRVAVVGSSASLGSWIPKTTCFLEQSSEDTHELRVAVDDPTAEYKYVILHGSEIQWEGGENRVVDTTKGDQECNDTWVSTGASEFIARTDAGYVPKDLDAEVHEGASETHEVASEVHEDARVVHDDGDRDSSEPEINENIPVEERVSSGKEQKRVVRQSDPKSDPKSEQQRELDSGDTKEPFVETRAQRTPFLLINSIFKLCRRHTTNAN